MKKIDTLEMRNIEAGFAFDVVATPWPTVNSGESDPLKNVLGSVISFIGFGRLGHFILDVGIVNIPDIIVGSYIKFPILLGAELKVGSLIDFEWGMTSPIL